MSIPVPDEISIEDPLCNSSLGSMVTLDYVTPLTLSEYHPSLLARVNLHVHFTHSALLSSAMVDSPTFPR